jgi:hypothetical protein
MNAVVSVIRDLILDRLDGHDIVTDPHLQVFRSEILTHANSQVVLLVAVSVNDVRLNQCWDMGSSLVTANAVGCHYSTLKFVKMAVHVPKFVIQFVVQLAAPWAVLETGKEAVDVGVGQGVHSVGVWCQHFSL